MIWRLFILFVWICCIINITISPVKAGDAKLERDLQEGLSKSKGIVREIEKRLDEGKALEGEIQRLMAYLKI